MAAEVLLSPDTARLRRQHLLLTDMDHSCIIKVPLGKGMEQFSGVHQSWVAQPHRRH